MSGNFLTPTALWKDFKIDGELQAEIIAKSATRGISVMHLRISGKKTADGEVGIYATLTHKSQLTLAPAIVIAEDFNGDASGELAKSLAEKGYVVLTVDIAGASEYNLNKTVDGVERPYTVYPESLSYANYDKNAEDKAEIAGDARATCWYEWARVIRYSVEYLKTQSLVTKIGVIGIGGGATPMWQVIASCKVSAAVIVANAGWKGYRKIAKFGEIPEPQFSDDALKYLAGIEPQAYAAHVKCPLMFLAPTNSPVYDIDRAYDTVSRVGAKVYTVADYSVGERNDVSVSCFNEMLIFLDAMLNKDNAILPKPVSIKGTISGDVLEVEVSPDKEGLKELNVFFAEDEMNPALRAWEKVTEFKETENGTYLYNYTPYGGSKEVFFFARAEYEDGMRICSGVNYKKLENKADGIKSRILYSSRLSVGANGFYAAGEKNGGINFKSNKNSAVKVKSGPMDIAGLFCPTGILTFKVNIEKYKPLQGAILMFDVFVQGGGEFTVSAITDYFGEKTVYSAKIKLFGGLWQNVKTEINNFKTEQGLGLKSYEQIEALEFSADTDFLINNILWV